MKQLIQNELIKLRAQKSYIVLSCLVLALVIIVSFVTSVAWTPLNMFLENGRDMLTESAAYDWAIKTIYEKPDSWQAGLLRKVFNDPKSDGDKAREDAQESLDNGYVYSYEYGMAHARFYDFRDDNELPGWVARVAQENLTSLYCWQSVANGMLDGKYHPQTLGQEYYLVYTVLESPFVTFPYTYVVTDYDYKTQTYTGHFVIYGDEGEEDQEISYEQVLSDIRDCLPICEQAIAETQKAALELEPDAYYDALIAQIAEEEKSKLESIQELQDRLDDTTEYLSDWEREYYQSEIRNYQKGIENGKLIASAYAYLKEKGAHPESNSFNIVDGLYKEVLVMIGQAESTLEGANANLETQPFLSRLQRSSATNSLRTLEKSLIAVEYAYKNDVNLKSSAGGSVAGQMLIKNLSTAAFLITVVTVVLSSMILSREFATGTIRLWVIRPRTRSKLLWSKIATLLIYVVSMMLVCFGITYVLALVNHLVDLFFYGESTLFAPVYGVVFGQVIKIPAVFKHLWALVVLTLPIILYAMFCLLVSTVTKKGVLSIVFGMIVLMYASTIQTVVLAVANYTGVFGYVLQATVLPYLSMENMLGSALDFAINTANAGSGGLIELLNLQSTVMGQLYGAMPYICSSLVGVIVLGVHIAFLMLCSLLIFKRMQIKS